MCSKNKNTVQTFLRNYYVPLDNKGNLNKNLFDRRMEGIAGFRENVYEKIGAQNNAENKDLSYALKIDSLQHALSGALHDTKEWKALLSSDYRNLPASMRYGIDKYEVIHDYVKMAEEDSVKWIAHGGNQDQLDAYKARMSGVDLTPDKMMSLVFNSFFYTDYFQKNKEDRDLVKNGWKNDPGAEKFRKDHKENVKELENTTLNEAKKNQWEWIRRNNLKNRLLEEEKNRDYESLLNSEYATGYFMSSVKDDQKKAKLSFGRRGSEAFYNMDQSVERVKTLLQEVKKTGSVTDEQKRKLKSELASVIELSDRYRDNKLEVNGIRRSVKDLSNSKTRARVNFAFRVRDEAASLLKKLDKIEKAKKPNNDDLIKQEEKNTVAGTSEVKEDEKQAVDRKELDETKDKLYELWRSSDEKEGKNPRNLTVSDTVLAVHQLFGEQKNSVSDIREYLKSSPLITEDEKKNLEEHIQNVQKEDSKENTEKLQEEFNKVVSGHREYIKENSVRLMRDISFEITALDYGTEKKISKTDFRGLMDEVPKREDVKERKTEEHAELNRKDSKVRKSK